MTTLDVYVLDEQHTVADAAALAVLIASVAPAGSHLEIAAEGSPYPMLDLLVRGDLAVVHYFAHDGGVPTQASEPVGNAPDEVDFPTNATREVITMPGSTAVSLAAAVRCASEFAEALQRPTSVGWEEL